MSLTEYKKKRDFKKTPEPEGKVHKNKGQLGYLIQKHAASRLHYDFRLELDGTLKSWAVPKGPSYDPKDKRLAVHVEDHPIEYGSFEGTIPKGQYGGGTVMLWDRGTWEPLDENPKKAYHEGKMKFLIHGEKLQGAWALIRIKGRDEDKGDNWLLFKERDEYADQRRNITEDEPRSVVSGRSLEEIANDADAVWNSNRDEETAKPKKEKKSAAPSARKVKEPEPITLDAAAISGSKKRAMPASVQPQLCTLVKEVPKGDRWVHEIKFDGYRMTAHVNDGKAKMVTRNGKAWTSKFPEVSAQCVELGVDCILDGEVVVVKPDGTSDFQALQNLLRANKKPHVVYYVFDLIWLDGYDLTSTPLLERKKALKALLARTPDNGFVRYSDHIQGQGENVFENACRLAMEGVISKQADSPYLQKRGAYWVKTKCVKSQEFVIGGYSEPSGARNEFGALLLGFYDESGSLIYAGRVGTGFSEESLKAISRELKKRETKTTPFSNPPKGREAKGVHWLEPELVCEVEFTEWTNEGILRHPSFKGLREDKPAKAVVRETPEASVSSNGASEKSHLQKAPPAKEDKPKRTFKKGEKADVAGVAVSNPDKILYPEQGLTKLELVEYYDSIADYMLPYIAKRPLTLVRCPQGRAQTCFYQKHLKEHMPAHVRAIPIAEKDGTADYIAVDNKQGLLELVQFGVLEFHIWGAREDKVEQPDIIVFDLDPDPDVTKAALVEATLEVRKRFEGLGLQTFLKTTGGKGFHVVVPLQRKDDWDEVKQFTKLIAEDMASEEPGKYVSVMSKAKRKGKIFVDYLRNGRGATFIAPFSTRARANAPVSMTLHWDELDENTNPAGWTVQNALERLTTVKDPWADFFKTRQSITAAMKKQVGLR